MSAAELTTYCSHAVGAAGALPSNAAVGRLVEVMHHRAPAKAIPLVVPYFEQVGAREPPGHYATPESTWGYS